MIKKIAVSLVIVALFTVLIVPAITHADFASFWEKWSGRDRLPLIDAPIVLTDEDIEAIFLAAPNFRLERTLLPEASSTYDIGSSTREWRALYVDDITAINTTTTELDATTARITTLTVSSLANRPFFVSDAGVGTTTIDANGNDSNFNGKLGIYEETPDFGLEIMASSSNGFFGITSSTDGDIFVVDENGNVGIGVAAPSKSLHVVGDGRFTAGVFVGGSLVHDGDTDTQISFADDNIVLNAGNLAFIELREVAGQDELLINQAGVDIDTRILAVGTTPFFVEGSTGNVGISTTTPQALLHVVQTGSADAFRVDDVANDTSYFVIDQGGNVGIGVAAPSKSLHVVGDGRFNADVLVGGALIHDGDTNTQIVFSDDQIALSAGNLSFLIFKEVAGQDEFIVNSGFVDMDTLIHSDSGTALFVEGSTGNVGIGTTTPSAVLDVAGGRVLIDNSGSSGLSGQSLAGRGADGAIIDLIGISSGDHTIINSRNSKDIRFTHNDSNVYMLIDSTGNVGIGTTTPDGSLEITTANNDMLVISRSGFDVFSLRQQSGSGLAIYNVTDSRTAIFFDGGGNVGIGDTTPDFGLEISASSSNGYFAISNIAGGDGDVFVVDESGNVGIGTTTPGALLQVGTNTTSDENVARFEGNNTVTLSNTQRGLIDIAGIRGNQSIDRGATLTLSGNITASNVVTPRVFAAFAGRKSNSTESNESGYMGFWTNNDGTLTEQMRIDSTGNVGIGTTTPGNLLHVLSDSDGDIPILSVETTSATRDVGMTFITNGGNTFTMGIDASDSDKFKISDNATLGTNDRLTIDSTGNVGIGTTTPGQILHVLRGSDGVVARFEDTDGTCDVNPTASALVCSSDRRLKKNIIPLGNSLAAIMALEPVRFSWTKEKGFVPTHIGLIAQDVEPHFPELVYQEGEEYKSLSYSGFVPVLIKAIQEQQQQIDALRLELEALKK
jgi:hypothetical protein